MSSHETGERFSVTFRSNDVSERSVRDRSRQSARDRATPAMRIVLVQTQAEHAGAQEISRILGRGLAERGADVSEVFFFRQAASFQAAPDTFICAARRPDGVGALIGMVVSLYRHIRATRPDAVLCFQHYGNVIAAPVARLAGCRMVIANQNTAADLVPRWVRWLDTLFGTVGVFSRIVVNSSDCDRALSGHPSRYRRRTRRIDHGFEPKTCSLGRAGARRELGLPEQAVLIGSAARLHPLKNLAAAIAVLTREPGWHLALAGAGQERGALEQLARSLRVADRVHFLGELPPERIGDFLAALDVFVFPSRAETFGLAAVEAAHAGVPVVANDLPVLREVLAADGAPCALFTDADDHAAFADAVQRVLTDEDLARSLAEAGRELGRKYGLDRMIDCYSDLLQTCMVET